jgi:hypothetical protein
MIETMAQIASIISAISAVTISLRALGKSREYSRYELGGSQSNALRKRLSLYPKVTIIWFILSIAFAAPVLIRRWASEKDVFLFVWIPFFLLLSFILWFIWWKIMFHKG